MQTETVFRITTVFIAVSGHFELLFVAKLRKFIYFRLGRRCQISRLYFAPRKGGPDLRKQQCCRIATMITKAHEERKKAGHGTHNHWESRGAVPQARWWVWNGQAIFVNKNMTTASRVNSFRNLFPVIVAFNSSSNSETNICSIRNFRHLGKWHFSRNVYNIHIRFLLRHTRRHF
jgi:hypothetical protein